MHDLVVNESENRNRNYFVWEFVSMRREHDGGYP